MFKDTSMRFLSANSSRVCESNCGFSAVGYKVGHKITKGLLYFWIWACFEQTIQPIVLISKTSIT